MVTTNHCDDYFQITWPTSPRECNGVCKLTDPRSNGKFDDGKIHLIFLDEVEKDGERGCPKCKMIFHSCHDFKEKAGKIQVHCDFNSPGLVHLVEWDQPPSCRIIPGLLFHLGEWEGSRWKDGDIERRALCQIQMYVQVGTPEPVWNFIKPGRVHLKTRREEFERILASWIKECDTTHDCTTKNAKLPYRVLDVGSTTEPRLLLQEFPEKVSRYVALSYCWGELHPPKTTRSSLAQHRQKIDFDTLPRSFQDAITVTRELGIEYLWIDSLCIVQDDDSDWQSESSKMATYYSNAYLVVAATQASDPSQGFLDPVVGSPKFHHGPSTEIGQIRNPNASISRIYKRVLDGFGCEDRHINPLSRSPLNARAWAMQEYFLAKRFVHFTEGELLWECVECLKCECMETDNTTCSCSSTAGMIRKNQFRGLGFGNSKLSPQELWLRLLGDYSVLHLSYESDILPALSGLAKVWESRGAGKYLAGFWEENILNSIMWSLLPGAKVAQRAAEYRAPSWSPFSLEDADSYHNRSTHVPFHYWVGLSELTTIHAAVVDAGVELAGADPTGGIKSAFLQLQGRVTRVNVCAQNCNGRYDIELNGRSAAVYLDIGMDLSKGLTLALILIGASAGSCVALALKSSGDAYERVGILPDGSYGGCVNDQLLAGVEETVIIR